MKNISYKRYIETFHVLEKYSEEYGYQLEHLLKQAGDFQDGFSILDIGAGTGNFARSFLAGCCAKASDYTAIEPSEEHVNSIKNNLRDFPMEMRIIRDKFTPKTALPKKYDLIIMSHCVYWFAGALEEHLLRAVTLLKDRGRLIIYAQTPATFCYTLNNLFREINPVQAGFNLHSISSRQVADVLERHAIDYDISYLPGALKATEIFLPENRKLLLDIISFTIFTEAQALKPGELKFLGTMLGLLSYRTDNEIKLNLTVGAITVVKHPPPVKPWQKRMKRVKIPSL